MLKGLSALLLAALRRTPLHPQWLLGSRLDVAQWVAANSKGRILDIGCSDRWIEQHVSSGDFYIGLDYLITGREMYGASPDLFADASLLPFADGSIDTVVMLEVLEHLRKPGAALSEICRVLRPEGFLLLSVPFLYPIHDAPHDYQRLTLHGLARDVEEAGFKIESLAPALDSTRTAALIVCLALGGTALKTIKSRGAGVLLLPLLLSAIPIINIMAWALSRLSPTWEAVTTGYRLKVVKRTS